MVVTSRSTATRGQLETAAIGARDGFECGLLVCFEAWDLSHYVRLGHYLVQGPADVPIAWAALLGPTGVHALVPRKPPTDDCRPDIA